MERKGSRTKSRHGHPPDRGGASACLGLARETKGKTANNTITATTSHQVPSSGRLHSQSCWYRGNREQRRQNAWPSLPAESVCRQLLLYGSPYLCHGGRDSGHDCGTKQPSKRAREAAVADILVPQGTMSTRAASAPRPPQATDSSGTGAIHRTEVLDAPSGSKERGGSEAEDKCYHRILPTPLREGTDP